MKPLVQLTRKPSVQLNRKPLVQLNPTPVKRGLSMTDRSPRARLETVLHLSNVRNRFDREPKRKGSGHRRISDERVPLSIPPSKHLDGGIFFHCSKTWFH